MMELIHISWAGPSHKIIDSSGKEWFFEMHHYCGPIVLKKDGDPRARQPGEKSPFWVSVSQWAQQGQKIDENNYCEYDSSIGLR